MGELERFISEMEVEMVGQGNVGLQANLAELRRDLSGEFYTPVHLPIQLCYPQSVISGFISY